MNYKNYIQNYEYSLIIKELKEKLALMLKKDNYLYRITGLHAMIELKDIIENKDMQIWWDELFVNL